MRASTTCSCLLPPPPLSPDTEELRAQLQLVALPAVLDGAPQEAAVPLMAALRKRGALLDAHVRRGPGRGAVRSRSSRATAAGLLRAWRNDRECACLGARWFM